MRFLIELLAVKVAPERVVAAVDDYGRPLVKLLRSLVESDTQTTAEAKGATAPQPYVLSLVVAFVQHAAEPVENFIFYFLKNKKSSFYDSKNAKKII